MNPAPLRGLKILVTRPATQARDFIRQLEAAGARVAALPTIRTVAPPSWKEADQAIAAIADYNYLIFSSVNGVRGFH